MLSILEFPARGVGPYPIQALPYLDPAHLSFTVNDVPVTGTVDDAAKLVTLAVSPAGGTVRVIRTTPRDQEDRLTQFLDLVTGAAGLTGDLLDVDYRQILYILCEARDAGEGAAPADGMATGADGQWDAELLRITNLAAGSSPNDAVTKAQLDTVDTTTRALPTVTAGDNDDGLFVTAGEFDDRTPAQCRTHLGLGTAAVLTAGVGANQVPQFDSSARYPANSGALIDITANPTVLLRAKNTVASWFTAALSSPGLDPSLSTWSQNSSSRVAVSSGWASRVELNNGGADMNGNPGGAARIVLTAGTWRFRWRARIEMAVTANATNKTSIRITNNDDTSAQLIYFDLGLHRPSVDFSGPDYSLFSDSIILTLVATDALVFRWTNFRSGGGDAAAFTFYLQKIK